MKKITLGLLLTTVLCGGCATAYHIRLSNGEVLTAHGKPTLDRDHNVLIYYDASGQLRGISSLRVTEVVPRTLDDSDKQFRSGH